MIYTSMLGMHRLTLYIYATAVVQLYGILFHATTVVCCPTAAEIATVLMDTQNKFMPSNCACA